MADSTIHSYLGYYLYGSLFQGRPVMYLNRPVILHCLALIYLGNYNSVRFLVQRLTLSGLNATYSDTLLYMLLWLSARFNPGSVNSRIRHLTDLYT